jgi:hypothetical protein
MKQLLLTNWNFFRVLRLFLGVMIIIQAFEVKDWMYGFAGLIFSLMALFNTGCCSVNGCATPMKKNDNNNAPEEVNYEEIK